MSIGPWPARTESRLARATEYIAMMSLPSTRMPGTPKPSPRLHRGAAVWTWVGSEMAHWLFWQKNSGRLGDGPLVVLAEEQHRGVEGAGEGQRLGDIALRGGAVAEAGDGHGVAVDVAGADVAVHGHTHGVAGGVQGLGADDDRVGVEPVVGRAHV